MLGMAETICIACIFPLRWCSAHWGWRVVLGNTPVGRGTAESAECSVWAGGACIESAHGGRAQREDGQREGEKRSGTNCLLYFRYYVHVDVSRAKAYVLQYLSTSRILAEIHACTLYMYLIYPPTERIRGGWGEREKFLISGQSDFQPSCCVETYTIGGSYASTFKRFVWRLVLTRWDLFQR